MKVRSYANISTLVVLAIMAVAWALHTFPAKALADPLGRFRAWEVSCGTSAATLAPPALAGQPSRFQSFEITNGSTQIFLGGSNVASTVTGKALAASATKSVDGDPAALYCRTASGSSTVVILAGQK